MPHTIRTEKLFSLSLPVEKKPDVRKFLCDNSFSYVDEFDLLRDGVIHLDSSQGDILVAQCSKYICLICSVDDPVLKKIQTAFVTSSAIQ